MVGQAHVLLARRDGVSLAGVAWRGSEREVAGGSLELEHVIWTGEPLVLVERLAGGFQTVENVMR